MSVLLDGFGGDLFALLQAISALALIAALAWLLRRARFSFGKSTGRALQVEERIALDLRSGLAIVRVEGRRFLLSTSDGGPARLLVELGERAPDA